jgi:hypothetical protein
MQEPQMSDCRAALGLPHIAIPSDQQPRGKAYYYCRDLRDVFGIPKADAAVCPACGRDDTITPGDVIYHTKGSEFHG